MAAGSIVIDLLLKTGSFETDTKRAEKRLKELETSAKKVGAAIGAAFGAAAVATAYFVKSSIDAADAAIKTAQSAGLTVEAFTALAFAADLSGVSQEELSTALVKLSRNAVDAAEGSKTAGAAFNALGINVKNTAGAVKGTDQLLGEIAEKFAGYADGAEKTALAVELFGRAGAKLIPLLNAGAEGIDELKREAEALGIVMDTKTAKAAEQLNDDMRRLQLTVSGFSNDLARAALPVLNDVVSTLVRLAKESRNVKSDIDPLSAAVNAMAIEVARSAFQLYRLGVEMGAFAAQASLAIGGIREMMDGSNTSNVDIAKRVWNGFRAISEGVKADTDRARKELDMFEARLRTSGGAAAGAAAMADRRGAARAEAEAGLSTKPAAPRIGGSVGSGGSGAAKASKAAQDALEAERNALREAERIAQTRADLRNREYAAIEEFSRQAEESDRLRLKALTTSDFEKKMEQTLDDIRFLNAAYADGKISVEMWAQAVRESTQSLAEQSEEMDQFAKTMADNVQSFLGSAFADAMEGNFKSIGRGFTSMINRMVAEALAADLARRLFGAASGGTGGGWIGAALSFAGSFFGGGKAGGGDVMPGREYWVGENGPERFRPRSMGTIIPASAGSQKTVTNNLNVNVAAQQGVSRQSAMQQGEAIGRGIQLAMARNG
jgi:hypothetical protein